MNITGKYLKAWRVEDKGSFKIIDLGDSDKNQDGTYKNFTWFRCLFVSKAAQLQINEKDTVEIINGKITMEKYQDKWSPKVVVFDAEIVASTKSDSTVSAAKAVFEDDIPF